MTGTWERIGAGEVSGETLLEMEETALAAGRLAGEKLMEVWQDVREVRYKGTVDLVTDADHGSEALIVGLIRERFPGHQILAEEGSVGSQDGEYRWVIDPLDGTTNYAHGFPHFAVSIAVEHLGRPRIGVVVDPVLDETFLARAGGGAYLNGRPIRVSAVDQLLRALVTSGFPYDRHRLDSVLRRWAHFARRCQALRRTGSAALDICYVAAGRFDAFWEDGLYPWDSAAGVLLVREAGGMVSDFAGFEPDLANGEVVASNGILHASMLAELAAADGMNSRGQRSSTDLDQGSPNG
jgi:myo-inositol-1(or 4)-monophosphatase